MINEWMNDNPASIGGGFAAALFAVGLLLSRFRALWSKDASDAAANGAQVAVIEMLRDENERLHAQVLKLQQEVAKLQLIVAELSTKLTRFEISKDQQDALDQMGREGRIERRRKDAGHVFD